MSIMADIGDTCDVTCDVIGGDNVTCVTWYLDDEAPGAGEAAVTALGGSGGGGEL